MENGGNAKLGLKTILQSQAKSLMYTKNLLRWFIKKFTEAILNLKIN